MQQNKSELREESDNSFERTIDAMLLMKRRYLSGSEGYREVLYRTLVGAMGFYKDIQGNEKFEQKFRRIAACAEGDLLECVVVFLLGVSSITEQKRAWKYCRALRHLTEVKNVSLGDLLDELKNTGIESLARDAAKEDPRMRRRFAKLQNGKESRNGKLIGANRSGLLSAEINISSDFERKLRRISAGQPLKIVALRQPDNADGMVFDVRRIIRIKQSAPDIDAWND